MPKKGDSLHGSYYFVIVGHNDNPLYDTEIVHSKEKKEEHSPLNQFIAHAALDLVDEHKWKTQNCYLKSVDKFNQWYVSAYVTPSLIKFIIVHDIKNEDGIRNFFIDVAETFIKVTLNPFYVEDTRIESAAFNKKVQFFAKRYLIN